MLSFRPLPGIMVFIPFDGGEVKEYVSFPSPIGD